MDDKRKPNANIAPFDIAGPGAQPIFQPTTILPALRAALALNCEINLHSRFDRKHYFYHDQPTGYQITQYYKPLASSGHITLFDHDGIAPEDCKSVEIGIKQVQIEQDTAKTNQESSTCSLIDFNRAGQALIEIITLPQIHQPKTAAACVRKIQAILQAVNANVAGIELGGLRADVNVSVRRRRPQEDEDTHSHRGLANLGQRTEIKNLVSFQAVEDAVIAERDRQIQILKIGGRVVGETRGWTIGTTETTSLRGKEGEIDYRYMPDPDIAPVFIGQDLVKLLERTLPELPDATLADLTTNRGLSVVDAKAIISLDNGERLLYFDEVYDGLAKRKLQGHDQTQPSLEDSKRLSKLVANWVLHELGSLLTSSATAFSMAQVSSTAMAEILATVVEKRVTPATAKQLLRLVFNGDKRAINHIITQEGMEFTALSDAEYHAMVQTLVKEEPRMVKKAKDDWAVGKQSTLMWFIGQVMKKGGKSAEAGRAKAAVQEALGLDDRLPTGS